MLGGAAKSKKFWKTEDEVIDEKLDIGFEYDNEYHIEEIRTKPSGDIYRLINLKKDIYEFQFRLKAFLTDFGRVKIAKIALQNINNVLPPNMFFRGTSYRISITLTKNFDNWETDFW